jgi:hypothetical protein
MGHRLVWGLLFAISSQAGCGSSASGNPDGGGGGTVTTVAGSRSLRTLTSAEATQVCSDAATYVNAHISVADQCKLLAAGLTTLAGETTDANIRSACAAFYASCTASGPAQTCDPTQVSTCAASATVTELSTCLADRTAATEQVIEALPACDALTAASLSSLNVTSAMPASCTHLMMECPDIDL